ncbi:MAG: sulfatase-like hydrolase/transferase [Campylobacteraceae bacterium]|jgi:glucan phosphoethanolaminetransferase (alkaline phosphatase superfamily)|nr:sulfatase-like hydrolase/transferase [Campylobacteraceae bacterium]
MKKISRDTKKALLFNFAFAALFAFSLILTDFILEIFIPSYDVHFDGGFIAVLFVVGLALSFNKSRLFFFLFIIFIFSLQLVQVCSIVYFGYAISPADIHKIFDEFTDIKTAALAEIGSYWLVPLALFIPLGILILGFLSSKNRTLKIPFIFILVLLAFVPKIERATRRDIQFFFPSPIRYSFHNTINAFSFYVGREIWDDNRFRMPEDFYKPYAIKTDVAKAKNILFVVGESVNPSHLSLFGYDRETTPFLSSLKENDDFYYQEAISEGVATHSALVFLLNGVREPGNIAEIKSKTFNLFRLAKENGFKTFFISAQDAKTAYEIGDKYIDKIVTKEERALAFAKKRDMALLDILNEMDFGERNFIVVQLRTPHAPYAKNYDSGGEFDLFSGGNERIDTYDNAILFFDQVMKGLFGFFEKIEGEDNYFIFTSDHGQAFGENGFWGHNRLDINVAKVPFIFYCGEQNDGSCYQELKLPSLPSHYEIAELTGSLLGYQFVNENADNSTFFVHGNNFLSNYEFITYTKDENNITAQSSITLKEFIKKNDK